MKGKGLSVVQEFGLTLLQRQDNLKRGEQQIDSLRLALVSSGRGVEEMFPEYFPDPALLAPEATSADFSDPEQALDLSGVAWEVPGSMTEAELADLEAFLGEGAQITVTEPNGGWA